MANIQVNTILTQQATQLVLSAFTTETVGEDTFTNATISVNTSAETLALADVITPGLYFIKNLEGSDIIEVSLDGGSGFPIAIPAGLGNIFRVNAEARLETATVQTVADVAGSLDATYFVVTDVNAETWAIGDGTLSSGEDHEISVTADLTDATAAEVAAAFYAAMIANTAFTALFTVAYDAAVDDDLITITDKFSGTRTNIADGVSTGFTLTTTQEGSAVPAVQVKSAGTSTVFYGVAPY